MYHPPRVHPIHPATGSDALDVGFDRKYRIGIVGLGARADKVLPDVKRHVGVELRAVCDVDPSRFAPSLDVPTFDSCEELLDNVQLDFIIVMTPHDTHLPIVRAAARRGVHVLKEKPFARSFDEALELQAICEAAGIHLMTILPRRFMPSYQLFHVWQHRVGQPFLAELRYTKFIEQPGRGWRGDRQLAGGGCLIDMGYHMVDLLLWNLGLPDTVHASSSTAATPNASYDAEDTALVAFSYSNGVHGSLTLSRSMPDQELVRLIGTEGILEATPNVLRFLSNNGALVEEATLANLGSPITEQLDCFLAVIRGDRLNVAGPVQHLLHATMVDACYASRSCGRIHQ